MQRPEDADSSSTASRDGGQGSCRGWETEPLPALAASLAVLLASLGAVCTLIATLQGEAR